MARVEEDLRQQRYPQREELMQLTVHRKQLTLAMFTEAGAASGSGPGGGPPWGRFIFWWSTAQTTEDLWLVGMMLPHHPWFVLSWWWHQPASQHFYANAMLALWRASMLHNGINTLLMALTSTSHLSATRVQCTFHPYCRQEHACPSPTQLECSTHMDSLWSSFFKIRWLFLIQESGDIPDQNQSSWVPLWEPETGRRQHLRAPGSDTHTNTNKNTHTDVLTCQVCPVVL